MNKLEVVKIAARVIVGAGTTTISNSIIRNNVEPANLFQQISVGFSAVIIGSMASEAARSHTDTQIDAIAEAFRNVRSSDTPVAPA